jgi:hypothetical protein
VLDGIVAAYPFEVPEVEVEMPVVSVNPDHKQNEAYFFRRRLCSSKR